MNFEDIVTRLEISDERLQKILDCHVNSIYQWRKGREPTAAIQQYLSFLLFVKQNDSSLFDTWMMLSESGMSGKVIEQPELMDFVKTLTNHLQHKP